MTKLLALNEIAGAVLGESLSTADVAALRKDSRSFIREHLGIDLPCDWSIVENSLDEVHLALPYYSALDGTSAMELNLEDLEDISGGEILITVFSLIGVGVGVGTAILSGVGTVGSVACVAACGLAGGLAGATIVVPSIAAGIQNSQGKNIDGSSK